MQTKEIHKGNIPPTDISMVWIDTTDPENIQVKVFLNGKWTSAADEAAKVAKLEQQLEIVIKHTKSFDPSFDPSFW